MTTPVDLVVKTVPLIGGISNTINEDVVRSLIATNNVVIGNSPTRKSARIGATTYKSKNVTSLGVGVIGASPQQLENAGVLKPGSAKIIQRMLNRGITDPKKLLPANLFTGRNSVSSLPTLEKGKYIQAEIAAATLKRSASALTSIGLIQEQTPLPLVAGAILSGATVGIPETVQAVNNLIGAQISSVSATRSVESNSAAAVGLAPSWVGQTQIASSIPALSIDALTAPITTGSPRVSQDIVASSLKNARSTR